MENSARFKDWLQIELDKRDWSYRELARRAGENASHSLVSQIVADKKAISWDFCAAIAEAFGYSPVEVFRIAGLLPVDGEPVRSAGE